jgi:DNA mismatch repair protein MutL
LVSESIRRAITLRLATPDGTGMVPAAPRAGDEVLPAPDGARPFGRIGEAPAPPYERANAAFAGATLEQPGLWTAAPEGFGALRFVAQVFEGYLLCDAGDRLVIVDQHAAHERVIFDWLLARAAATPVERDALLVPEAIAVSRAELAHLAEHSALLERVGLEGEPFGDETFLLRSIPRALRGRDAGELVRAVAADLVAEGVSRAAEHALERVLATVACHAATRVGQRLAAPEATALLEQMDAAAVNAHCPHGRPVAVQLARSQLEALFGR